MQKSRGLEGSGVEGRGGRRRSRSFTGSASPRLGATASPNGASNQQVGGGNAAGGTAGKRKRSLSFSSSAAIGGLDAELGGKSEASGMTPEECAKREREDEEAREAAVSVARPALVFCRVVDALQHGLKSGWASGAGGGGGGGTSASSSVGQGILELFLSGGDEFLLAASRAAHEAYEAATCHVGSGGGVDEIIAAMGLRSVFAAEAGSMEEHDHETGESDEKREKRLSAACLKRVMNLLCEGELFAAASSRSS